MNKLKARFIKLGTLLRLGSAGLLITVGAWLAPLTASAALTVNDLGGNEIENELYLGTTTPDELVVSIINWVLALLALIAVIMILVGGFKWMTAGGNEEKVESAKKLLIAALIGLVIILAAWGIATYVINNLLDITNAE